MALDLLIGILIILIIETIFINFCSKRLERERGDRYILTSFVVFCIILICILIYQIVAKGQL